MQTRVKIKSEKNQRVEKRRRRRKNAPKPGYPIGLCQGQFLLDSKKEEIIQLLMQNMPMSYIAAEMHVSVFTVHYYLKKHPYLVPETYRQIKVRSKLYQKEEYILQKLNAGVTKAAIARELGVSREALFNKLEQMGWQEPNPYRKKKIDLNLFLKAFNEGKTYQEMASLFHCHKQTIINKLKELHLSRYKKRALERQEKNVFRDKQRRSVSDKIILRKRELFHAGYKR